MRSGSLQQISSHLTTAISMRRKAHQMGAMFEWLDQMVVGGPVYDDTYSSGYSQSGEGLTEAPRGALGHWLNTASSSTRSATGGPAIATYQVITPTCWNASPMDGACVKGPMEQVLIGTPVSNETQPWRCCGSSTPSTPACPARCT